MWSRASHLGTCPFAAGRERERERISSYIYTVFTEHLLWGSFRKNPINTLPAQMRLTGEKPKPVQRSRQHKVQAQGTLSGDQAVLQFYTEDVRKELRCASVHLY